MNLPDDPMQDPRLAAYVKALQGGGMPDLTGKLLDQQAQQTQQMGEQAQSRPAYGAGAGIGQGLASLFSGIHGASIANQQKQNIQAAGSQNAAKEQALMGTDPRLQALIQALQQGGGSAGGMVQSGAAPGGMPPSPPVNF